MLYKFQSFAIINIIFILLMLIYFVKCSTLSIKSNELNTNSSNAISCSSLDNKKLRIITFDLFGALMLTVSSLQQNIASVSLSLSSADIKIFTNILLCAYISSFVKSFLISNISLIYSTECDDI